MNQLSPNTKQFLQAKSNDYGGIEDGTCQFGISGSSIQSPFETVASHHW
ncbi:MAG: hypothetical protein HC800_25090 [Phormidesmis sp. RL_2_1]|nr:hypothetical protein [Phormidesmis sp. RL_2_1]